MKETVVPTTATILVTIALVLSSCSLTDSGDEELVRLSPVARISDIARNGTSVSMAIVAVWPNTCGKFSHTVVEKEDHIYTIDVFGKQNGASVCGAAFTEFNAVVTIAIAEAGSYLFRFRATDSTFVDTTVAVGVFAVPADGRIDLTNGTDSTIYYDTYPSPCDGCIHSPVCVDPVSCARVVTDETAEVEELELGTVIRWWRLVPDNQGPGYRPDHVRILYCGADSCSALVEP